MSVRVGIPKEIRPLEGRIALTPSAVSELCRRGVEVGVQRTAGELSRYADADDCAAGATLLDDAVALYDWAQLVVKVKEPYEHEVHLLRAEHRLFCYLHLAANPELTASLCTFVSPTCRARCLAVRPRRSRRPSCPTSSACSTPTGAMIRASLARSTSPTARSFSRH